MKKSNYKFFMEIVSDEYLVPLLTSNLVALVLLFLCWKYPNLGRLGFAVVFLLASITNAHTALNDPASYLMYGELALLKIYKTFIYGFFSQHIQPFVLSVALGQMLISIGLFFKGKLFRPALLGAIVFSTAIIPLGIGSGLPTPLIMVISLSILYANKQLIGHRTVVT